MKTQERERLYHAVAMMLIKHTDPKDWTLDEVKTQAECWVRTAESGVFTEKQQIDIILMDLRGTKVRHRNILAERVVGAVGLADSSSEAMRKHMMEALNG